MVLKREFYLNPDVVEVARQLLGKVLVTQFDGHYTSGIIVETEAYAGINDRASHAFGGKITPRNRVMYQEGGTAYVYLCYGIHSLFNVVTNQEGIPHAVLVRGIYPLEGLDVMSARMDGKPIDPYSGSGPGKLTRLLGIHYRHSGISLLKTNDIDTPIWIEDRGNILTGKILITRRVGVDYAGEDAHLPYRFILKWK